MLTKCSENCPEEENTFSFGKQEICSDPISSNCVILGEDMNLCSIDVESTDSIKKIIGSFDKVLCGIKDRTIDSVYNDIDITGSCITKALIVDAISGKKTINLGIDPLCITAVVNNGNAGTSTQSPFLIYSSKYSICGTQTTTLTSSYPDTVWYSQAGIVIGNGTSIPITKGGNYYASRAGKISNIVNIIYTAACDVFSYTKIKSFYKDCAVGTVAMEYTYSKIYTSEISYQDALAKSEADLNAFTLEGQTLVNSTGKCIGDVMPVDTSCFNVFLTTATCNIVTVPTAPTTPTPIIAPTTTPITPISSCTLSFTIGDIICGLTSDNTPTVSPTTTPVIVVPSAPTTPVTQIVNTLVDMTIPVTTQWNYFNPDIIPSFQQAKTLDPKTGEYLPNKWAIYHAPYRTLFGSTQAEQLTKMFNKGWTAINASKIGGYFTGVESIVTADRIVVDGGFANTTGTASEDANYDNFEIYAQSPFGYASTYNIPKNSEGKWRAFLSDIDYESTYTAMDSQLSANFHVTAFNSGLSVTTGRYGFQYGGAMNGSYTTEEIYTNGNRTIWTLPADNTVKPQYRGKALSDNNRFVGRGEVSYYFEEFLPQDYQVKDQDGNNWFKINHFGGTCAAGCGQNSFMNADSWATQLGAFVEINYKIHHALNQDFIIQIKPVNERDNGFKYSEQNRAYYGNKRIFEYNRYGTIQPNPAACANCEFTASMGSEYITPFMAEAQIFLAYASGAKGVSFWSSGFTDVAYPHDKSTAIRNGAKYNDVQRLNADLDPYIYTMKALWRMDQKINLGNGASYSFNEICDGTEIYLNENTKVVYPGSNVVTQYRAIDWQLYKKTPVRAIVNVSKNVVFVVALQAYGVEQPQITFKLTDYGANISEVIDVPAGKVVVKAYSLVGGGTPQTIIEAPFITQSVSNPTPNQSVVLTASACQTANSSVKWYDSAGNILSSGNTYTVNAQNGASYYARCVGSSATSAASNLITFNIGGTGNVVNVFVLAGESNPGTRNELSTLPVNERGLRQGIRILNNNTNQLEQLNIGVNNYLGENASIANGWGMEAELANLRANGTLNTDIVVLKTAQGGALIGQYNSDISGGYYSILLARANSVKSILQAEGKTPVFHIIYSQGINNALYPGIDDQAHFPGLTGIAYWKAATLAHINNLRSIFGQFAKISIMKMFEPYGSYLNNAIQEIVNTNTNNTFITTVDLELQPDGIHLGALGIKVATDRHVSSLGFNPVPSPVSTPITVPSPVSTPVTPVTSNVTIVQPNRVANFYKSVSGSPEIISSYNYSTDDNVYLSNSQIKVGFNLRYGGAISYLSQIGSTVNMVNNGSDGGRQIQPDYYQKPQNYTQNGKIPTPAWANNGYNTTLGGDYNRNTVTLLEYYPILDGYYIKFKPIFWGFEAEVSEIVIEVTYVLVGNAVKCTYNYINQRTDAQIPTGTTINGWALPVAYLNQHFTEFYSYLGNSPFTNDTVSSFSSPNTGNGEANSKEFWGAMLNPATGVAVGVYNKMVNHTDTYFQYKKEVSGDDTNSEFSSGCLIFQTLDTYITPDSHFTWNRTDTSYLIVGTIPEVRSRVYQISAL